MTIIIKNITDQIIQSSKHKIKSILVDCHTLLCHVARNLPSLDYESRSLLPDLPSLSVSSRGGFLYRDRASYRYWQRGNRITLSCIIVLL